MKKDERIKRIVLRVCMPSRCALPSAYLL